MEDGAVGVLPTKQDEEFRPFIRRLPEFKFWHSATRALTIGFACTWFNVFDIPVFWPVLVVYWFILFALTSKLSPFSSSLKNTLLRFDTIRVCLGRCTLYANNQPSLTISSAPANSTHDQISLCSIYFRQGQIQRRQVMRTTDLDRAQHQPCLHFIQTTTSTATAVLDVTLLSQSILHLLLLHLCITPPEKSAPI